MRVQRNKEPKKDNLVFGIQPVLELFQSDLDTDKILIQKNLKSDKIVEIKQLAREHQVPCQLVPIEKLDRVTRKNHQGVIAFTAAIKFSSIDFVINSCYEKAEDPFVLVLDEVTDVRNFGAIARTAECCGVNGIIIPMKGAAQINSDAVRTSAGALNHIAVARETDTKKAVQYLKDCGLTIVASTEKTDELIYSQKLTGPIALVMGSEEYGISTEVLALCDHRLKLPLAGKIGSLNVSAAASAMLYELRRQRDFSES